MESKEIWENFYKNTPLDKVPWQKTQADFLYQLVKENELGRGTALDLGCGTGIKAILLAKSGFKVTAIDISATAIKHAKANAKKAGVDVEFLVEDATDLSFLGHEKFDLILDWANLHGIEEDKREKYIKEVVKHIKSGGKLVLRCFSKYKMSPNELGFLTPMGIIYLFSEENIKSLYGKYFKILRINRSRPHNHPYRYLDEYLMERI